MRSIAVFIDGTKNDQTDVNPTNILKMHRSVAPEATSLYFRGLGNEFDNEGLLGLAGRLFGGAFGAGADDKMDAVYAALSAAWQDGDRLFIFGFSRGAAIARRVAAKVAKYGLNGRVANVALLGCFDTVASFGIPGNDWNLFMDFHVAPNVMRARHAVAEHETRDMFPVTLMNQSDRLEEVWFRGDHSDVGGGHESTGLSDIALHWMTHEAQKAGLPFIMGWHTLLHADPHQAPFVNDDYHLHTPRVPGTLVDDEFREGNVVRYSTPGQSAPG